MSRSPGAAPGWTHEISLRIRADGTTVFNLLAGVELWPALFEHVRSARVLRRDGRRRLLAIRAKWRGLPLGYTAVVAVDVGQQQLTIQHVSPLTRGSVATWTVVPVPHVDGAVDVHVCQHVTVSVSALLARVFVGGRVARDLGQSMLHRLKEVAEGGSLASPR